MSPVWQGLRPTTVAGQLTGVVVAAVLFGVVLASAVMFYLVYSGGVGPSHDTMVQVRAARIAATVNGVVEAHNAQEAYYAITPRAAPWSPTSNRSCKKAGGCNPCRTLGAAPTPMRST